MTSVVVIIIIINYHCCYYHIVIYIEYTPGMRMYKWKSYRIVHVVA